MLLQEDEATQLLDDEAHGPPLAVQGQVQDGTHTAHG